MNNKLNNLLNDFFLENENLSEDEVNEKLQEFLSKYNNGEIEYENTLMDDAYDLLEQASNAKTISKAKKLAQEAYDMCPACFDAILFLADLEDDPFKVYKLLDEGLKIENERLHGEDYFSKDNIGHFYGIFETRPYIRGLYLMASVLANLGKIGKSIDICREILRLNKNDNTGARYLLMADYAMLEDEKEMLSLYKKYSEEQFEMLFPFLVLYYKLDNDKKALLYLDKINKANPNFVKLLKGNMEQVNDVPDGYYAKGDVSEIAMYFDNYVFLVMSIPSIYQFILNNSKKEGKKKKVSK